MLKNKSALQNQISDPLRTLYEVAGSVLENSSSKNQPQLRKLAGDVLTEILYCQVRFLTSIYVALFLQKDYSDREMDRRVRNYLNGIYATVNELLGLCEELSPFLLQKNLVRKYPMALFQVPFEPIRLKAPPLADPQEPQSVQCYRDYEKHVWQAIESFRTGVAFLQNSRLDIDWHEGFVYDTRAYYQEESWRLIHHKKIAQNAADPFHQLTGSCRLCLPEKEPIQLDPFVIPLYNRSRGQRLAALAQFRGFQLQQQGPVCYHELKGDGRRFHTDHPFLFKQLFEKKGLVSETPEFIHRTLLLDGKVTIELYQGDIFDLNFMENTPNRAMVNLIYANLANKTLLSKCLENLAGVEVFNQLRAYPALTRDRVYVTGPGELPGERRFQKIFHCPVYDVHEGREVSHATIKTAIAGLLDACVAHGVACLVVPAMGAFWAGQTRQQVASAWIDAIQNHIALKDSALKRIIFSFINPETCTVYQLCLKDRTNERFAACHLPVSKMHSDIVNGRDSRERLNKTLDLNEYLYSFMVAWGIRSILWEKLRAEDRREACDDNPAQQDFLQLLFKRTGFHALENSQTTAEPVSSEKSSQKHSKKFLRHIKESAVVGKARQKITDSLPERWSWSKGLNVGGWRELSQKAYLATKGHEWSFDHWFSGADKSRMKTLLQFLHGTGDLTDFAALRNDYVGHPRWHWASSAELKNTVDTAVADIQKAIEHLSFLRQDKNRLALIEEFKVNEDTGRCRITYRDLGGEWSTPPTKTISVNKKNLGGRLFEFDRVYLIENLPDESVKALNMHPFILYGECPGCHRNRLFVWRDFKWKAGGRVKLTYGSTTCKCGNIDEGEIAGNSHEKLNKRFEDILAILRSSPKEPSVSLLEEKKAG